MTAAREIPGVIIAGGRSSRMGRDKAGVRLGGTTLVERAAARLRPQVASLAVNANGPVSLGANEDLPVFADLGPARAGPLGGVLAALDHVRRTRPEASHVATVPIDSPFFPTDLVARLHAAIDGPGRIVVARSESGLHPVFALWPLALAGDLAGWLAGGDTLRVKTYLERRQARDVAFPSVETPRGPLDPFFNINTPADLDEAERWLQLLDG